MDKTLKDLILKNKQKTSSLTGWYKVNAVFARTLLQLNVKNYRKLNMSRVNMYASDMAAGLWKKNGETIVVGKNGIIQDGQHRLHAIVKADVEIECFIIFDAEITNLYDVGSARSVYTMLAADSKPANSFDTATGRLIMKLGEGKDNFGSAIVYKFVDERTNLLKKASSVVNTGGNVAKKAACGVIAYCMLKTNDMSEAELRMFFRVVNTGNVVGCTKDPSPALVLHKQLSEMNRGGGQAVQKIQTEITYKALRDFKFNNSRKVIYKYDTDDAMRYVKSVYDVENKFQKIA